MKKYFGLGLLLLAFSGASWAGYIDPQEKAANEKWEQLKNKYVAQCKTAKIKHTCEEKAWKKASYEVPRVRGNNPYMEQHYGNLTKGQAVAELKKLIALYPQVKDDEKNPDDWAGKVSPTAIDAEASYILRKYFNDRGATSGISSAKILVKQVGNRYN
ncbi:hypothetical protein [Providencia rettgeri]|uniref:hypothetical protein n=1 Tax=Providencia rettgeri TaxID=587 RepID=UPI001419ECEC|nr:hypothetical protein [Providencia rettgeri]NIH07055.1 hypothetical protein [Providencia rettgeri]